MGGSGVTLPRRALGLRVSREPSSGEGPESMITSIFGPDEGRP